MQAGLALVPGLAAMIAAGLLVVPIATRYPPRIVVPVALVFSVAAYVVVAFATGELPALIGAFVALGIGIGAAETVSTSSSSPAPHRRRPARPARSPRPRTSSVRF